MPKATATTSIKKNTVIAQNKPLGLLERITITPDTRAKFAEVGKRKPNPQPVETKVVTRHISKEESQEIIEDFLEEQMRNALVSVLLQKKRRLEDRIEQNRIEQEVSAIPLVKRIAPAPYQAPAPPPKDLHFQKQKKMDRKEEVWKVLEHTKIRIDPIFKILLASRTGFHPRIGVSAGRSTTSSR